MGQIHFLLEKNDFLFIRRMVKITIFMNLKEYPRFDTLKYIDRHLTRLWSFWNVLFFSQFQQLLACALVIFCAVPTSFLARSRKQLLQAGRGTLQKLCLNSKRHVVTLRSWIFPLKLSRKSSCESSGFRTFFSALFTFLVQRLLSSSLCLPLPPDPIPGQLLPTNREREWERERRKNIMSQASFGPRF